MKEQVQKIIDLTEKSLTQMAESMNIALPQLWEILIKQQYVEAIQSFAFFSMCLIIIIISCKKTKAIKKSIFFNEDTPICMIGIFGTLIFCILFCIAIVGFFEGIGQIINPEYYAIKDIAEFIEKMKGSK